MVEENAIRGERMQLRVRHVCTDVCKQKGGLGLFVFEPVISAGSFKYPNPVVRDFFFSVEICIHLVWSMFVQYF